MSYPLSDSEFEEDPTPFLFISFDTMDLNKDLSHKLLEMLESKNEVFKAETEEQALCLLDTPNLKSVLVADGAVGGFKHKVLCDCLVEFAKEGGTVVHACAFSSFITSPSRSTRYLRCASLSRTSNHGIETGGWDGYNNKQ